MVKRYWKIKKNMKLATLATELIMGAVLKKLYRQTSKKLQQKRDLISLKPLMERLQLCVSQSRKTKGFNMFLMVLLFTC
jgi:hypothetical protein